MCCATGVPFAAESQEPSVPVTIGAIPLMEVQLNHYEHIKKFQLLKYSAQPLFFMNGTVAENSHLSRFNFREAALAAAAIVPFVRRPLFGQKFNYLFAIFQVKTIQRFFVL